MRRALIGIMMGASLLAPAIAQAREPVPNPAAAQDRTVQTAREARQAAREARQAARQESRAARQTQRASRPAAASQDRRAERREQRQERREERRAIRQATPAPTWPGQRERVERIIEQRETAVRQADRREERRDARQERREDRREARRDRREDRRDIRQDRREVRRDIRQERREWNRAWRQDRRYDWQRYRWANRSIFNLGRYYAPYRNHRYNRFSIGVTLGSGYYGSNYWINDPWQYRLPPAYPGTRWVRYYDDVLLVDLYNGRVIDVIYDFFW